MFPSHMNKSDESSFKPFLRTLDPPGGQPGYFVANSNYFVLLGNSNLAFIQSLTFPSGCFLRTPVPLAWELLQREIF